MAGWLVGILVSIRWAFCRSIRNVQEEISRERDVKVTYQSDKVSYRSSGYGISFWVPAEKFRIWAREFKDIEKNPLGEKRRFSGQQGKDQSRILDVKAINERKRYFTLRFTKKQLSKDELYEWVSDVIWSFRAAQKWGMPDYTRDSHFNIDGIQATRADYAWSGGRKISLVVRFTKAYEEAWIHGEKPRKGTVLALHDCSGYFLSDWTNHLTSQGFLVVMPYSFADPRPPRSCRRPHSDKLWIYDIRLDQTVYALQKLRKKYPSTKIFVWGHSEGAGVANLLDEKVDGIITTGYPCGYRNDGVTYIREDVPLLAIMGTNDPYLSRFSLRSGCKSIFRSPQWKFMIVDGMGHVPFLTSHPAIREQIDRLLGLNLEITRRN